MYNRKIESSPEAKQAHDIRQKKNATERLKAVAAKKKAKRG